MVPKCARQLHRRAVLGRKALPLTPAAVYASWPVGRKTAIGPILTRKQLFKTAAWEPAEMLLGQAVTKWIAAWGVSLPAGSAQGAALDLQAFEKA